MHFRRDYEENKHLTLQMFKKTHLSNHLLYHQRKNTNMFENMRKTDTGVMG